MHHKMHHPVNQTMRACDGDEWRELVLPAPEAEVLDGVLWGGFDQVFSPAFWAGQAWLHDEGRRLGSYKLGTTLREEVVACVLGGYGIPAEVGLAAFENLRTNGLLSGRPSMAEVATALSVPLSVRGRCVSYRFASQRARYVANALARIDEIDSAITGRALRDALTSLEGVGLKTASWITRNWCDSDEIAILDVHVCRACERAGVFAPGSSPARDYLELEDRFLTFAEALGVRASLLDNLIWQTMRRLRMA